MYLRWIRNAVRPTSGAREDVLCFHVGAGRYALSPQVIESYRDPQGTVRKRLLWTPGRAIRTCCAVDTGDPVVRALWWLEVAARIDVLRSTVDPDAARVLESLPALLATAARTVPMPTDAESAFVEAWTGASASARERHETLRSWYERCWQQATTQVRGDIVNPAEISYPQALALLKLQPGFTQAELKSAYRAAVFIAHPDRGGSHAQFVRVGAAYALLQA